MVPPASVIFGGHSYALSRTITAGPRAKAGLGHPNELRPQHILKRMSASEVKSFAEVYKFLGARELIAGTHDPHYAQQWAMADHRHFAPKPEMRNAA